MPKTEKYDLKLFVKK